MVVRLCRGITARFKILYDNGGRETGSEGLSFSRRLEHRRVHTRGSVISERNYSTIKRPRTKKKEKKIPFAPRRAARAEYFETAARHTLSIIFHCLPVHQPRSITAWMNDFHSVIKDKEILVQLFLSLSLSLCLFFYHGENW